MDKVQESELEEVEAPKAKPAKKPTTSRASIWEYVHSLRNILPLQ
jgi:hypothetical protein